MNQCVLVNNESVTFCRDIITNSNGEKLYICLNGFHQTVQPIDENAYINRREIKHICDDRFN